MSPCICPLKSPESLKTLSDPAASVSAPPPSSSGGGGLRGLAGRARGVSVRGFWGRFAAFVRAEKHWLWVVLPFLAAWWQPMAWQWHAWGRADSALSYQPFVPLGTALLIWARRQELRDLLEETRLLFLPESRMRRGSPRLLATGAALLMLSHLVRIPAFTILSLLLVGVGVIYHFYGLALLRALTVPLLFLLLMLPPPESPITAANTVMQFGSAMAAGTVVRKLGLFNTVQGTFINFPNHALEVEPEFGGLSVLLPTLALALWLLLARRAHPGYALLLLIASVFIALAVNLTRIGLMGAFGAISPFLAALVHDANPYLFVGIAFFLTYLLGRHTGLEGSR